MTLLIMIITTPQIYISLYLFQSSTISPHYIFTTVLNIHVGLKGM